MLPRSPAFPRHWSQTLSVCSTQSSGQAALVPAPAAPQHARDPLAPTTSDPNSPRGAAHTGARDVPVLVQRGKAVYRRNTHHGEVDDRHDVRDLEQSYKAETCPRYLRRAFRDDCYGRIELAKAVWDSVAARSLDV